MIKPKLDPEIKLELLIKLAFGIPIETLAKEYDLTRPKIINLRKNNYLLYNDFYEHWRIDEEVAALGLAQKHELAVSILKKFYKKRLTIDDGLVCLDKRPMNYKAIMTATDVILKKDNINCWLDENFKVLNHY